MPEGSRYKFEGMQVDQPNAGVGTVDLGSLYSSFRGIDRTAWQLQDETIVKDLLAGATPQAGFEKYMNLASIAGAAGDSLASVTFQQKAYSLLDAAKGGRGGGGSGSGSSGVKESLKNSVDALKEEDLPILQDNIKQISEAIKSGVVTPTDGLQDIYTQVADYQKKAQDLYAEYSQYIGQKGYSGIKAEVNALAKEAGIGFGANDGDGSKAVNKVLQENLYGKTVQDGDYISQLSEDFTKLSGPDGSNYVMAFVPQTAEGGLANQLSTNATKQNGIVFTTKDLAEGAKLRPVQRVLGDGSTVTIYVNPSSTDEAGLDQLLVPTFDQRTGETINRDLKYQTLTDDNGNVIGSQYTENGKTFGDDLVIAGKTSSSTNAAFPGGSIDTSQTDQGSQGFDILHPFKSLNKEGYTTNVGDLFKNLFSSQAQAAETPNPNQGQLNDALTNPVLNTLFQNRLMNTTNPANPQVQNVGGIGQYGYGVPIAGDPNVPTPTSLNSTQRNDFANSPRNIFNVLFPQNQTSSDVINPLAIYGNNTLLSKVINQGPPNPGVPGRGFQSVIDSIKAKNQQQAAARQAPVVQLPETPTSISKGGLVSKAGGGYSNPFAGVKGGVQGQVSAASQTKSDPLQLRNQASLAALGGFKQFANFLKGIF